jgi:hypothetical protein
LLVALQVQWRRGQTEERVASCELMEQREDTTSFEFRGDGPERSARVGRKCLEHTRGVELDTWANGELDAGQRERESSAVHLRSDGSVRSRCGQILYTLVHDLSDFCDDYLKWA